MNETAEDRAARALFGWSIEPGTREMVARVAAAIREAERDARFGAYRTCADVCREVASRFNGSTIEDRSSAYGASACAIAINVAADKT